MENLGLSISDSLKDVCRRNRKCSAALQYFLAKQIWTPGDRASLLDSLSSLLVKPSCTQDIGAACPALTLDLLVRARQHVAPQGQLQWTRHQRLSVALGKLVATSTDARRFAVEYLLEHPPFYLQAEDGGEPQCKKPKKKNIAPLRHDILQAVLQLLQYLHQELLQAWDWTDFVQYTECTDRQSRWFACQSIIMLVSMSSQHANRYLDKHFTPDERRQLAIKWENSHAAAMSSAALLSQGKQPETDPSQVLTHTLGSVVEADLCTEVISVCGVLLPVYQTSSTEQPRHDPLVSVDSTRRNLRSLALAVASGNPVLLEGPVGCGKTTLVEHLAHVTGRGKTPYLMKVQLGDQTDSKALLGTYRCTEVPGEFVWSAGALTQAVRQGHWLLLEDLDLAPMDVVSLLVPLLQQGTLSIPGHGDTIHAHPAFRIFATHRLLSSGGSWYKVPSMAATMLERMWTRVAVEPLSRMELQQVIIERHPQLGTVVERLLDIYFLLSAGSHDTTDHSSSEVEADQEVGKFLSRDGRLISTRDLMKWASRIAMDFNVTQSSTAHVVFQEALDCFCACLAKPDRRSPLAEAIGARLNVTKAKAEFFCEKHKPNIEITTSQIKVGRVVLERNVDMVTRLRGTSAQFAFTRQAVSLLERVAVCVMKNEPVLLVGETGTGKTSSVQYLAHQMGSHLRVVNMNQQSDSTDLLGGYKPLDLRFVIAPFRESFEMLFCRTFSRKQNTKFLNHVQTCFSQKRWGDLLKLMEHTQKSASKKFQQGTSERSEWDGIAQRIHQLKSQVKQAQSALAFAFIEGTLVKALKAGDWVLLDEINLASTETLECLSGLLESSAGSVVLMERGDTEPIVRHPNFRLFACMNPATDVGKKDLPMGVRNRFTEFYVDELEDASELKVLVTEYLKGLSLPRTQLDGIVKFYLQIRNETVKRLTDGTGHRPHYSLRTLCRALRQSAKNASGNVHRSLYEGFCLAFLTELDRASHPIVEQLISTHVVGKANIKAMLKQPLPPPPGGKSVQFEGFWVGQGKKDPHVPDEYVLTPSVRANLRDLTRVVSAGRYPVLIQGETSVGKTSLVNWLSAASGNVCVRINNHEHTDLQEYVGCYAADETGKLVFKEGVLVEAMKKGFWIILDELNLAPTDVLEALNRLLDDNRELYIPETQETIKAHKRFMLFATQNPPGQYGGRKVLSRAFRNRFVELHFDEIPSGELEMILHERCQIPMSYCKRLVAVMLELQKRRRSSGVFAGKQGFMTLRDLFRWAERYRQVSQETNEKFFDWDQQLADNGFLLLAGRVRQPAEIQVIQEVLEMHLRRKVDPEKLFNLTDKTSPTTAPILRQVTVEPPGGFEHVVWTYGMRRMAVLVGQALKFGEPVLLVGDTGCGKTTIVQLFAGLLEHTLHSVNCHMHTEGADFLGGLRPVRQKTQSEEESQRLFEWCDGPLVLAMKEGSMLLIDEISLADDSVLERLNSVLEPERTLLLAEKGGGDGGQNEVDQVVAKETFRVVGTMNPGGDYGKKELSPALRNRFTEIWCPQSLLRDDLVSIIEHNLKVVVALGNQQDGSSGIGNAMMDFVEWFSNQEMGRKSTVSIRDLLSWVHFINVTAQTAQPECEQMEEDTHPAKLEVAVAYIHGACLVFLDALGSGVTSGAGLDPSKARQTCLSYLRQQVETVTDQRYTLADLGIIEEMAAEKPARMAISQHGQFGIPPFYIARGTSEDSQVDNYALHAPTTSLNAQRVLRALQLSRPILLEGSPGVGKTSLVAAVAKAAGHELVRINLSEQTDVSDLFGADLPVEGGKGGEFAWRDGPLLRALKAGHWVVLDELNLASQSVLEGLNACLDHRAEVYVPELGKTFQVQHEKTRLFACQNPLHQGGGRKGLPRSFLNRFTQVYVEPLTRHDLLFITRTVFPQLPLEILSNMVDFNQKIHDVTMVMMQWGQKGSPWEFNLRDIFRWCQLMLKDQSPDHWDAGEFVGLIYSDRMRTAADKDNVYQLYEEIFGLCTPTYRSRGEFHLTSSVLQVGHSFMLRDALQQNSGTGTELRILHRCLAPLDSLMKVLHMNWMAILLGPASSGKTSLVQLLAQLTGRPLDILPMNSAMDTTELLGGFEQADLNRHLEEIGKRTKHVLDGMISNLLLTNQDQTPVIVEQLIKSWSAFQKLSEDTGEEKNENEIDSLKRRLARLTSLLNSMAAATTECGMDKTDVSVQLEAVKQLSSQLEDETSVNQGGRFEWVDSPLVKALQQGRWLLIDNVNFCSPSVLDRLNGLLEPGGVLSISERGVIDGQVPTITPHPDFRLILTMDPRYGEISRAMRNRGIEISLLGEDDGGQYDDQDLMSMLQGLGIAGLLPCQALLGVHQALQQELVGADHVSLLDLLQAASNCHQQMERGTDFLSALRAACHEVYVKGHRDLHLRKKLQSVIDLQLDQVTLTHCDIKGDNSDLLAAGLWPDSSPSVADWLKDVSMATVRQVTTLFLHYINVYVQKHQQSASDSQSSAMSTDDVDLDHDGVEDLTHRVLVSWRIALEQSGFENWQLMNQWLSQILKKRLCNLTTDGTPTSINEMVIRDLEKVIGQNLASVYENPVAATIKEEMKQLVVADSDVSVLYEQSLDLRWNPQLRKKLLTSLQVTSNTDATAQVERLDGLLNRLMFIGQFSERQSTYLSGIDGSGVTSPRSQASLLQLSCAYHKGLIERPALPHPGIVHLYPFLVSLLDAIGNLSQQCEPVSNEQLKQMEQALRWFERYLCICRQPVGGSQRAAAVPDLALHWSWLYKKALPRLLAGSGWRPELQILVERLQTSLGSDSEASRLYQSLRSAIHHPHPYPTVATAEVTQRILALCCLASLHGNSSNLDQRVACHVHSRLEVCQQVLSLLSKVKKLTTDDLDGITSGIGQLHDLLQSYGLIPRPEKGDDDNAIPVQSDNLKPTNPCQVALWPLYDQLTLLTLRDVLSRSLRGESSQQRDFEKRQQFVEFAATRSSVNPSMLIPLKLLNDSLEVSDWVSQQNEGFMDCLCGYLNFAHRSLLTQDTDKWLQWKQGANTCPDVMEVTRPSTFMTSSCDLFNYTLFSMLADNSSLNANSTLDAMVPSNVTLGLFEEKVAQLKCVSQQLWTHASSMASKDWDESISDGELIKICFRRLLSALRPCLKDSMTECDEISSVLIDQVGDWAHWGKLRNLLGSVDVSVLLPQSQAALEECVQSVHKAVAADSKEESSVEESEPMDMDDDWDHEDHIAESSDDDKSWLRSSFQHGHAWAWIGLIQSSLLVPQGPVDPAHKQVVKLDYMKQQLQEVNTELSVREEWVKLTTGQSINLLSLEQHHPRLQRLLDDKNQLETKIQHYASDVAYRPQPSQFPALLRDMQGFISSSGSAKRLVPLLEKLSYSIKFLTEGNVRQILQQAQALPAMMRGFADRVMQEYPLYRDLYMPCLTGILYMAHGFEQMAFALHTTLERSALVPRLLETANTTALEDMLETLAQFPSVTNKHPDQLSLVHGLVSEGCMGLAKHLQDSTIAVAADKKSRPAALYVPHLLKSALLHVKRHALQQGHLDADILALLGDLFAQYITSWQKAEEERQMKEAEEASLYRFKARSHGDDLTEDQRDAAEIKKKFPSFEQEFSDLQPPATLDDKPEEHLETQSEDFMAWHLNAGEMEDVCQVHQTLFLNLTQSPWLPHTADSSVCTSETLEPFVQTYKVAADISAHHHNLVGSFAGSELIGGHLIMSQSIQDMTRESDPMAKDATKQKPYDIYRDPNVYEAVQCRHFLESYQIRITELLVEWPDHPTLVKLSQLIDRILGFPVTSPLMKFVAGLEAVLTKTHEWECNAARHVSLNSHQETITQMVIQWRKLELKCWNSCLDTVIWNHQNKASSWWFHLYQILQSFLDPTDHQPSDSAGEEGGDTSPTPAGIVKAVQQFMENCPLGEYEARLKLLQAFTCQLVHLEQSDKQETLLRILWSSGQFYAQFKTVVSSHIAHQRTPIEKQLKGFVKIARWNDINFWSVKSAVEKTHQILHKHTKEWDQVLRQPVKSLLSDTKSDWSQSAGEAHSKSVRRMDAKMFLIATAAQVPYESDLVFGEDNLLGRLPVLCTRMKKHCARLAKSLPYPQRIEVLDQFTGEVIEGVHELQSSSVIQGEDIEKQKADARLLHQQKRKALAELFRTLQRIGLSYKKGLHQLSTDDPADALQLQPLDVSNALSQLAPQRYDSETAHAWEGCNEYVFRCVARRALLHTAALTPSQELGMPNLERCKGFTENLKNHVYHQRKSLCKAVEQFMALRKKLCGLHEVRDDQSGPQNKLPPQQEARSWMTRLQSSCIRLQTGLEQMQYVLRSCPKAPQDDTNCLSPVPAWTRPEAASWSQADHQWVQMVEKMESLHKEVCEIKRKLTRMRKKDPQFITWAMVDFLHTSYCHLLHKASPSLAQLEAAFIHQDSNQGSCLSQTLTFLKNMTLTQGQEFSSWWQTLQSDTNSMEAVDVNGYAGVENIASTAEGLVTEVLLAVQSVVKSQADGEGNTEEDLESLEVGHLTEILQCQLEKHMADMKLKKVLSLLEKLTTVPIQQNISATDKQEDIQHRYALKLLLHSLPLVEQYTSLVQYFLSAAIATHRATAKLLSVLLAVFTELVQKGFCLPSEVSDELSGEGATEFEDIEGGGLGEGEGAKDVSDQIESEDQLHDAHREGEEKQENNDDQPDVKEEDNAIEMTDDMEGKLQDLQPQEGDNDSENEDQPDPELEKQMGDLEGADADRLDEQMWGSDEEEEEKEENKETKEEFGPGAGAESEADLVAKDDNEDQSEADKDQKKDQQQQQQQPEDGDQAEPEVHEAGDEREYDENEADNNYGQDQKPEEAPEAMDIPDELNLDGDDDQEEEEDSKQDNPQDLDKMAESGDMNDEVEDEGEVDDKEMSEGQNDEPEEELPGDEGGDETSVPPEAEDAANDDGEKDVDQEDKKDDGQEAGGDGVEPQVEPEDEKEGQAEENKTEESAQAAEHAGKTEHDTTNVQQSEGATDAAGDNDNESEEKEGVGQADSQQEEGHQGDDSSMVTQGSSSEQQQRAQQRAGKSKQDRTVGSAEEKVHRRLQTVDSSTDTGAEDQQDQSEKSDLYEHVKESSSQYDTQTLDAATAEQEQPVPGMEEDETEEMTADDEEMKPDDREDVKEHQDVDKLSASKLKKPSKTEGEDGQMEGETEEAESKVELDGERVDTHSVQRGPDTTIHTKLEHLHITPGELDIEKLRQDLEQDMHVWRQHQPGSPEEARAAQEAWQQYEALTSTLAQELCEQLRLVLEPTQASKLKGDYRTGKRLNMRKVIPYIASQFRKDKIWLRRTQPSKRNYQVMVAVDDSSSMDDNHSKQLAFESLCVIANALTLLEVGQLGIASFGESVKVLHSFQEQFSSQSGAQILQQFTFEQKKTKIAQLLDHMTAVMVESRSKQHGMLGHPETSQLLLVMSDGRGLFLEGMEAVRMAVRRAREANIFLVFVIVDNPDSKDSILDIKVPVFKGPGQLPEIQSYMDHFPFPFYLILRDLNSLPQTLSDALRQWFELVTAADK